MADTSPPPAGFLSLHFLITFSTPRALNRSCSPFPCSPPPPSLSTDCFQLGLCSLPLSSCLNHLPAALCVTVRTWEYQELWWVWALPSLQANLWAWPWLHDCRQKTWDTWVRERGELITHSNSRVQSIIVLPGFLSPSSHRVMGRGPSATCAPSGLHYRRGTWSLGSLNLLYWAVCKSTHRSRGSYYLYLPRLFAIKISLKSKPRTKVVRTSAFKMCRNTWDLWRTVSQSLWCPCHFPWSSQLASSQLAFYWRGPSFIPPSFGLYHIPLW